MKQKKIAKCLSLKKTTIANLESRFMNDVVGGAPSYNTLCETWGENSCNTDCFSDDPPAICQDHSVCDCISFWATYSGCVCCIP